MESSLGELWHHIKMSHTSLLPRSKAANRIWLLNPNIRWDDYARWIMVSGILARWFASTTPAKSAHNLEMHFELLLRRIGSQYPERHGSCHHMGDITGCASPGPWQIIFLESNSYLGRKTIWLRVKQDVDEFEDAIEANEELWLLVCKILYFYCFSAICRSQLNSHLDWSQDKCMKLF